MIDRGKVICACTSASENTAEVGVEDLDARAVNGPVYQKKTKK